MNINRYAENVFSRIMEFSFGRAGIGEGFLEFSVKMICSRFTAE